MIEDLKTIGAASADVMNELRQFINSPDLPPEKFESLKARSADVFPKFEKILNRSPARSSAMPRWRSSA